MEKITAFFESIDFEKLVPQMDTLLGKVQTVTSVALIIGPIVMLVLGLIYFFLPPKEANHKAGFRTWFGMGSVEAWRFTQKLAGLVWGGLGLILTIIMGIICLGFGGKEIMEIVTTAFTALVWQAVLALIAYFAISLVCAIHYKSNGQKRR